MKKITHWLRPDRIKAFLEQEQLLVRGALLILCTAIITGTYFLEHLDTQLEAQRKFYAVALTQQVSQNVQEYVLTGNLVSLNVIAKQISSLQPVAYIEFRNATDKLLARAGEPQTEGTSFSGAIQMNNNTRAGTVLLTLDPQHSIHLRKKLETGFALLTLLLLVVWTIGWSIWRKLKPPASNSTPQATRKKNPATSVFQEQDSACLYISIVNLGAYQKRFTPALIEELISGYQSLLEKSASVYNGSLQQGSTKTQLGKEARILFAHDNNESAFKALCTGMLFLRLAKNYSEQRKQQGRTPLEFKLMVGHGADGHQHNWKLCTAGVPGRVQIEEQALTSNDLDTRLLYHPERAVKIHTETRVVTLQPIEQLAQRYHKLLAAQAEKLMQDG